MRKFLLTLLSTIFANPFFAQPSSAQTKNFIIEIAPEVKTTLTTISKDFKFDVYNNICSDFNKTSTIELTNPIPECPTEKQTISTIYSCVCEPNGAIYTKIQPITEFKELSGTTIEKLTAIQKFYNALSSIPLATKIQTEIQTILANNEEKKLQEEAEKQKLLEAFKQKLTDLLKEEQSLRTELANNLPSDLEKHAQEIENVISTSNIDTGINKYIEKIKQNFKDKTPEQLKEALEQDTEIEITNKNIEKLKAQQTAQNKKEEMEKENAEKREILSALNRCTNNIGASTDRLNLTNFLKTDIPPGYVYLTQSIAKENCASLQNPVFEIQWGQKFDCSTTKFLFPITQDELKQFEETKCGRCENPKLMSVQEAQQKLDICLNNYNNILIPLENILEKCGEAKNTVITKLRQGHRYTSLDAIKQFCENSIKEEEIKKQIKEFQCVGILNFKPTSKAKTLDEIKEECQQKQRIKLLDNLRELCSKYFRELDKTCKTKYNNCYIQLNKETKYNHSYNNFTNILKHKYYDDIKTNATPLIDNALEIKNAIAQSILDDINKKTENSCGDKNISKIRYLQMLELFKKAKNRTPYGS